MKKYSMIFFIMMIFSTMITSCSNNWISMWLGMEINMITFIPLIFNKQNNESNLIYFIIQSISSIMMIFSSLMMIINMYWIMNHIMMCSLFIKLSMAPFHNWMIMIISKMNWMQMIMLLTWQKIAPLIVMNNINNNNMMMLSIIMLSITLGALGGINQTTLRKIIGFSSINHMGWLMSLMNSQKLWINYLMIYFLLIMLICSQFYNNNIIHLNQMMNFNMPMTFMLSTFINMLSLGGLPPLLGFYPKWIVTNEMITNNMITLNVIMIMLSLLTLLYYLHIINYMLLMKTPTMKFHFNKNYTNLNLLIIINLTLPMILIMY